MVSGIEVIDVVEFVVDVAKSLVNDFLEEVMREMLEEIAFSVCFQ